MNGVRTYKALEGRRVTLNGVRTYRSPEMLAVKSIELLLVPAVRFVLLDVEPDLDKRERQRCHVNTIFSLRINFRFHIITKNRFRI